MRIGLVVDGDAEYQSIRTPLDAMEIPNLTIIGPTLTRCTPLAPPDTFAAEAAKQINILVGRNVDRILVLVDMEQRDCCVGDVVNSYHQALTRKCPGVALDVVVKHRTYENWLIADLDAIRSLPARFNVSQSLVRKVSPNKADNVDAYALLKRAARGKPYDKVLDAKRIADKASALNVAKNSRSYRRFLRLLGHTEFLEQSRLPPRRPGRAKKLENRR